MIPQRSQKETHVPSVIAKTQKINTETPEGYNWLVAATDPFHDYLLTVSGYPDSEIGNTTVQVFKRKVTLSKPPNLDEGQLWDCHITTLPILQGPVAPYGDLFTSYPAYQWVNGTGTIGWYGTEDATWTANYPLGTVCVASVRSGNPTWPAPSPVTAPGAWNPLDGRDSVFQAFNAIPEGTKTSMCRLIAGGLEVHNDTSPMYVQGASTSYVMSQDTGFEAVEIFNEGDDKFSYCSRVRMPPSTVADAALIPNSIGLKAEQGILAPFVLDVDNLNFEMVKPHSLIVAYTDVFPNPQEPFVFGDIPPNTAIVAACPEYPGLFQNRMRHAAIETTGTYFTGLSSQTVLTLEMVFIIESRPTPADPTLLSLASPACPMDPLAIKTYAEIRKRLPPGVPVDMNAKGDWFRMVQKVAREVAPYVPRIIGLFSPRLGQAAQLTYDAVRGSEGAKKAKPKAKPAPQPPKNKAKLVPVSTLRPGQKLLTYK